MSKPKVQFLQIRLTEVDRQRLSKVAQANHLDSSTWARQVLLRAVDKAEAGSRKGKTV